MKFEFIDYFPSFGELIDIFDINFRNFAFI